MCVFKKKCSHAFGESGKLLIQNFWALIKERRIDKVCVMSFFFFFEVLVVTVNWSKQQKRGCGPLKADIFLFFVYNLCFDTGGLPEVASHGGLGLSHIIIITLR